MASMDDRWELAGVGNVKSECDLHVRGLLIQEEVHDLQSGHFPFSLRPFGVPADLIKPGLILFGTIPQGPQVPGIVHGPPVMVEQIIRTVTEVGPSRSGKSGAKQRRRYNESEDEDVRSSRGGRKAIIGVGHASGSRTNGRSLTPQPYDSKEDMESKPYTGRGKGPRQPSGQDHTGKMPKLRQYDSEEDAESEPDKAHGKSRQPPQSKKKHHRDTGMGNEDDEPPAYDEFPRV
ncbi:hypothetical protein MMC18_001397 [Xylographa bjoerkii]|nr:hypothetical protein [Xylographa bjoerkii]